MKPLEKLMIALLVGLPRPLAGMAAPEPRPAVAADPLAQLNAAFREGYAQAKAGNLDRSGPVLLMAGETLELHRDGRKLAEEPVRSPLYHRLKAVAHVPLALDLLLGPAGVALSRDRAASLQELATAARKGLDADFPEAERGRQARLLDASLALLADWSRAGGLEPGRLDRFARETGPLVLANAEAAAAVELELLDRACHRFQARLGPEAWSRVRVVIIGSHMAREGEVSLQYFLRRLGEPGEGGRIVFAEGLWDPADALALLATHRVDAGIGAAFFGDPARMHRDVLADGARRWLDRHRLDRSPEGGI